MKVSLAVPIRTGCSQASGGLTPRGLALGSHTGARWWESSISLLMTQRPVQNMRSYKTSKIRISESSPDIFLLFLSIYSWNYWWHVSFKEPLEPASLPKPLKGAGFAVSPACKMCYLKPPLPQQDIFWVVFSPPLQICVAFHSSARGLLIKDVMSSQWNEVFGRGDPEKWTQCTPKMFLIAHVNFFALKLSRIKAAKLLLLSSLGSCDKAWIAFSHWYRPKSVPWSPN